MKKLLITTMAAVSVGLCAKADDAGFISGTSFEDVPVGAYLEKIEKNGTIELCKWYDANGNDLSTVDYVDIWMTAATDAQLVVSNLSMFAGDYLLNANRPQQWSGGDNTKALYIDTDKPLMRYVHPSIDGKTAAGADLDQDIFFDSVVQFTATDVAAEPDSADKLRVWLYTSPDDVATTPGLFKETTPKTCLVVTAGKYEGDLSTSNLTAEHYEVQIDGVELRPDTWHRLTIKAIADIDPTDYATPGFEIWVDGKPVTYGADKKTQFPSLKEAVRSGKETLQCVAFDGKGAVDDIVFTTTAPEFAKEPEAETYAIVATGDNAQITFASDENGDVPLNDVSALDVTTTTVYGYVIPVEGYEVTSAKFNGSDLVVPEFDGVGYNFLLPIGTPKNGDEYAFVVTVTKTTGGGSGEEPEEPAKPTVGGVDVVVDDNGKITNITTANNGQAVTGEITDAMFADYYAVSVVDGKLVIAIDPEVATPQIDATSDDADDAIVVTDAAVALGVTNAKAGLWYGAQAYSDAACAENDKLGEPTGWVKASGDTVTVTAAKPTETKDELTVVVDKAFFKVVVDDQDHTPPAEGQE